MRTHRTIARQALTLTLKLTLTLAMTLARTLTLRLTLPLTLTLTPSTKLHYIDEGRIDRQAAAAGVRHAFVSAHVGMCR